MTISETEIKDFADIERLDVSRFDIKINKRVADQPTRMAIVGLGATGSAFILLLGHFLRYNNNMEIHLFDGDHIERHNYQVSMYGIMNRLGISYNERSKAHSSHRLLNSLVGNIDDRHYRRITLNYHNKYVNESVLMEHFGETTPVDFIFVFTDTNESRFEISQYHSRFPETKIFDIRVGSYDQFEVYFSASPDKYHKTIYFDDDGSVRHIEGNRVCLDDRMSFSVAMAGASYLMNLFTKFFREELDKDFLHVMLGRDYIGEVKGYDE